MQLRLSLIAGAMVVLTAAALAQGKGPNGGMVSGTGGHQAELVVSPNELAVYLLENGKRHSSKGSKMRVVIQQAGKTTTINMVDQQGEKLVAKLAAPLDKGAIVVLTGKDHHGDQFNARYVIQ